MVDVKRPRKQRVEFRLELRERKWRCPECGQVFVFCYDRQSVLLRELLRVNKPRSAAYILKEDFRAVFDEEDQDREEDGLRLS